MYGHLRDEADYEVLMVNEVDYGVYMVNCGKKLTMEYVWSPADP